jgi:GNAT superfamily N-acetyltransferase
LNEHASEHTVGIEVVAAQPDGRKTVDIRMATNGSAWVQTIEQVLRERPSRLVSRSWTWTERRDAPVLSQLSDRRLSVEADGTRLAITVEYKPAKASALQRARLALQRGAAQLELECLVATCPASLTLGEFWMVRDLFVNPRRRRTGVAGALLDAVRAAAERRGALRLTLQTEEDNAAALRLYEQYGFVPVSGMRYLALALASGDARNMLPPDAGSRDIRRR